MRARIKAWAVVFGLLGIAKARTTPFTRYTVPPTLPDNVAPPICSAIGYQFDANIHFVCVLGKSLAKMGLAYVFGHKIALN